MALSKDEILKAPLLRELVPVPEWGGEVWVQEMSALTRTEFLAQIKPDTPDPIFHAMMAALSIVDEHGEVLFGLEEVQALEAKSETALRRVSKVAIRLSVLGTAELEKLEENFTDSQSEESPTG